MSHNITIESLEQEAKVLGARIDCLKAGLNVLALEQTGYSIDQLKFGKEEMIERGTK